MRSTEHFEVHVINENLFFLQRASDQNIYTPIIVRWADMFSSSLYYLHCPFL